MRNGLFALALIAGCASLNGPAFAATHTLEANLDGLQVSPPNASPAFGYVNLTLDDVTGQVTLNNGSSYNSLLGGSTGVTLNGMATPGNNAPSLITLTLDNPGATTGTLSGGGTLPGIMAINGMIAGNTYINLRSQVFPSGEIRGQLIVTPEPASVGLLGIGATMLMQRRRHRRD